MNNYIKQVLRNLLDYIKNLNTEKDFYKSQSLQKDNLKEIQNLNIEIQELLKEIKS